MAMVSWDEGRPKVEKHFRNRYAAWRAANSEKVEGRKPPTVDPDILEYLEEKKAEKAALKRLVDEAKAAQKAAEEKAALEEYFPELSLTTLPITVRINSDCLMVVYTIMYWQSAAASRQLQIEFNVVASFVASFLNEIVEALRLTEYCHDSIRATLCDADEPENGIMDNRWDEEKWSELLGFLVGEYMTPSSGTYEAKQRAQRWMDFVGRHKPNFKERLFSH